MRFFFFQAEDGIRDLTVTGVQTCALPILRQPANRARERCAVPGAVIEGLVVHVQQQRDLPRHRVAVSRIAIFCQILRDNPAVRFSTSFTASSTTGSCKCSTYNAATLLVSDSRSVQ